MLRALCPLLIYLMAIFTQGGGSFTDSAKSTAYTLFEGFNRESGGGEVLEERSKQYLTASDHSLGLFPSFR